MWSSLLVNLQACRLIAGNFTMKWTPSQVFFGSILSPHAFPMYWLKPPPPHQILKSTPPPPMFSKPVGNPVTYSSTIRTATYYLSVFSNIITTFKSIWMSSEKHKMIHQKSQVLSNYKLVASDVQPIFTNVKCEMKEMLYLCTKNVIFLLDNSI